MSIKNSIFVHKGCTALLGGNPMQRYLIGNLIRSARELKNMTQNELAKKLNVTVSAVSNWENNLRYPRFEELISLAKELDIGEELLDMKTVKEAPISKKEIIEMSKKIDYISNRLMNLEMKMNV